MTKNKKIILSITLIIFSFSLFKIVSAVEFVPQVTIPNSEFTAEQAVQLEYGLRPIGNYIKAIYNYALIIVGILAAIVLIIGGIIWLTSAGNSEKISQAKSWITGALTGLILMFLSYTILKTINPQLVSLRVPGIQTIGNVNKGCCKLQKNEITNPYLLPGNTNNVVKLTFNATIQECYNRALALEELYIQPFEELSKKDRADLEGYMKRHNKFFPNSIATGFNQCKPTGAFIKYGDDNYEGTVISNKLMCLNTIETNEYYNNDDNTFGIFKPGLDCNSLNLSEIKKIIQEQYPNHATTKEDFIRYSLITCEEVKNGKHCKHTNIDYDYEWRYCYNKLCYPWHGELGEPCGVDKSYCLPSNTVKCKKIPGFRDRNTESGGRSCADGLFCCRVQAGYWEKLGY